jgi:hypothetical protein
VNFKNELERFLFEAAKVVCGEEATIEHNKTIRVEVALANEVASFVGPPKKEIDVITAGFRQDPALKVLISSKDYGNSKAEPADVQEWAAVINTLNQYSAGTKHLGIIVCPSGFTSGCEPWASCHNLGIIPPLKGKKLRFATETSAQMFERVLRALAKRLNFPHEDLFNPPHFYEFAYELTEAFEGRDEAIKESAGRYRLLGKDWVSSFGEVVRTFRDQAIEHVQVTSTGIYLTFSSGLSFRMLGKEIAFGADDRRIDGKHLEIRYEKNFAGEPCSFEFIKQMIVGQKVTSAGDWGDRFEFGLTDDLMLAIEPERLQIYRTRNPPDKNLL